MHSSAAHPLRAARRQRLAGVNSRRRLPPRRCLPVPWRIRGLQPRARRALHTRAELWSSSSSNNPVSLARRIVPCRRSAGRRPSADVARIPLALAGRFGRPVHNGGVRRSPVTHPRRKALSLRYSLAVRSRNHIGGGRASARGKRGDGSTCAAPSVPRIGGRPGRTGCMPIGLDTVFTPIRGYSPAVDVMTDFLRPGGPRAPVDGLSTRRPGWGMKRNAAPGPMPGRCRAVRIPASGHGAGNCSR